VPEEPESRRDRQRRLTLDEIKAHALRQVLDGGPESLSLNAIGKAMGMSGPAVYRYFASRDAVLGALVTDGYAELAAAVQEAAAVAARRAPERRLDAVASAYREWALARPRLYGLLFGLRPDGYRDPDAAIEAIDGAMVVLLEAIGAIVGDREVPRTRDPLDAQLRAWSARREGGDGDGGAEGGGTGDAGPSGAGNGRAGEGAAARADVRPGDPLVLRLGVLAWTRLHGLVDLELAGVFADMGLDPARLVAAEMQAVAASASAVAA
jgi:AcrR family transcriptional regulator